MLEYAEKVLGRINKVLSREGREKEEITVVAVTKGIQPEIIRRASEMGFNHFGENRIQEAKTKIPLLANDLTWHMIGHLQRNKVKAALKLFDLIQSLDSDRLATEISRNAQLLGQVAKTLVQVNTTSEQHKFGVPVEGLQKLLDTIDGLKGIRVVGLMTIGPFTDNVKSIRTSFRTLRKLFEDTSSRNYRNVVMHHLSMGMTDDFEIALEEGANMLRIGRAIFGPRTS